MKTNLPIQSHPSADAACEVCKSDGRTKQTTNGNQQKALVRKTNDGRMRDRRTTTKKIRLSQQVGDQKKTIGIKPDWKKIQQQQQQQHAN
ncbi:hypothetical protein DAPPUDRAFT_233558 [Daphnia pulex]|uniref:Uncharacterized protein n=1 Tax=Daphnia pulex TaxID=6669 RepID=E9FV44_DAPPU|nr:hypothetical protein DAPPUDRAFT_233558 [Daphnia pulex]|eukprot:EFX89173.1 hypothetical protein DAPPUDRAFT_233558 [Daphnia pulex]